MAGKLRITIDSVSLDVELFDTITARTILDHAPFTSSARVWGDEVYFSTPVVIEKEPDAKEVIEPGELAFWVEGQSIAIGYGPTPVSEGDEIRLVTEVNIWGRSLTDVKQLSTVKAGDNVKVSVLE